MLARPLEYLHGHRVRGGFGNGWETFIRAAHDVQRHRRGIRESPQRNREPRLGEDRGMYAVGQLA